MALTSDIYCKKISSLYLLTGILATFVFFSSEFAKDIYSEMFAFLSWPYPLLGVAICSLVGVIITIRYFIVKNKPKQEASIIKEKGSTFKTWVIPLPFFHFHHEPYRRESSHRNFIGRSDLSDKFLSTIKNSQNSSGSYLITGYRGVGKTSFVKKVLEDYRNGKPYIAYSLRLSQTFKGLHKLSLCLIKCYGWLSLQFHKCLYSKTKWGRDNASIAGNVVKYATLPFLVFEKKWRFNILLIALIAYSLISHPSFYGEKGAYIVDSNGGIYFYVVIAFLIVVKLYELFGVSIFNPKQWFRWLFNPVLVLHINLGHEKLDTKQLLFDIVSLLKIRYVGGMGILSIPKFLRIISFLLIGVLVSHAFYHIWIEDIKRVEEELQDKIFTVYYLTNSNIESLHKELGERVAWTTQEEVFTALKKKTGKNHSTNNVNRSLLYQIAENPKDKNEGGVYLSRAEYEKALESVLGKDEKERHILTLLRHGDKSAEYELGKASNFCKELHKSNGLQPKFKAEASTSQFIYCNIDDILKHMYLGLWKGFPYSKFIPNEAGTTTSSLKNKNTKEVWGIDNKSANLGECNTPYCESWFKFIIQTLAQDLLHLTPPNRDIREYERDDPRPRPYHLIVYLVSLLCTYLIYRLFYTLGAGRVIRRLNYINKRIVATSENFEVGTGLLMSGLAMRKKNEYHPLDSRQTEFLLLDVLETNHRLPFFFPHPEFVFVFDELDKIDPASEQTNIETTESGNSFSLSPSDSVRMRKFEVEQLLSNLKNIITVAPCRFIFIAGRDMMDANLADQGEVNHLYSSLFDETLYIPSFLTDHSDEEEDDISSMVEQYVCRRLLPQPIAYYLYQKELKKQKQDSSNRKQVIEYGCWNLKVYLNYLNELTDSGEDKEYWEELASFLLDFIYYLTYRSAGSPKKLSMQFEQFVYPTPSDLLIRGEQEFFNHPPVTRDTQFMLKFDEREQYQIQLISHIFIMLHGETSHMVRQYGDKLSLSTFSILDYLFKYHSIAFSMRDLERMPDVLDIHRAPALPQVIDVLLEKMLTPYLQRLKNGVYEFSFLQHFQREVVYISQFSERDLAAFNFTLDESINIKQHYQDLLKRQMKFQKGHYQGIQGESKESETWHTLPSLHIILGDIYTLDREFSEALTEYRNALQYLEPALKYFDMPINGDTVTYKDNSLEISIDQERGQKASSNVEKHKIEPIEWYKTSEYPPYPLSTSMKQLLQHVQILLKMGLLAERRDQYDISSAHYFKAYRVVDHVLKSRLGRRYIIPNFSLLPILYQPYICLAYVHVKRDLLSGSAVNFIQRAYEKLEVYLREAKSEKSNEKDLTNIEPDETHQVVFLSRIKMNWAEVLVQQSRFEKAGDKYIEIIQMLIFSAIDKEEDGYQTENIHPIKDLRAIFNSNNATDRHNSNLLDILGATLSGLGDMCCALCLKSFYKDNRQLEIKIPDKGNLEKILENDGKTTGDLKHWGLYIYLLSAEIYKISDKPSEAALSLWKIQYVLSYGLTFRVVENLTKEPLNVDFHEKTTWLFKNSELGDLAENAFEASYVTHRKRLKDDDEDIRKDIREWIAPPLKQISMVLTKYWEAEKEISKEIKDNSNKTPTKRMSYKLRHMGAFPIHARILAGYLKSIFYLRTIEHMIQNQEYDEILSQACQPFHLLVQSAEDGSAYEGGMDSLNPHLGTIYYLLWRLLEILHHHDDKKDKDICFTAFKTKINKKKEFSGEKGRFLSRTYCGARALKLLSEITGRHTRDNAFTNYINRQYYLHGAFSDPYVQGLWAIDYAICPAVERMKKELRNYQQC